MNFWQRIENILENKGMTRKELAASIGFNASNISKGKKTGSCPSAETAVAIAAFLGTTVEFLVTGKLTKN